MFCQLFNGRNRKTTAALITLCCIFSVLPISAAGGFNSQEDQEMTGKSDTETKVPVYGAIGNLDGSHSMDIDGDGTADITLPEADLIEVSVTPSATVNVFRGEEGTIQSVSAESTIKNLNADNRLKVSLESLEAANNAAKQIKITENPDQNKENGLNLSIYAKADTNNAFARKGQGEALGQNTIALANTAKSSPVPVTLGTLSEKGGAASSGTFLFKADCRNAFIEKYQGEPVTYQAVFKFTIQK